MEQTKYVLRSETWEIGPKYTKEKSISLFGLDHADTLQTEYESMSQNMPANFFLDIEEKKEIIVSQKQSEGVSYEDVQTRNNIEIVNNRDEKENRVTGPKERLETKDGVKQKNSANDDIVYGSDLKKSFSRSCDNRIQQFYEDETPYKKSEYHYGYKFTPYDPTKKRRKTDARHVEELVVVDDKRNNQKPRVNFTQTVVYNRKRRRKGASSEYRKSLDKREEKLNAKQRDEERTTYEFMVWGITTKEILRAFTERVHDRYYECPHFWRCQTVCKTIEELFFHLRNHSEEVFHTCEICGIVFMRQKDAFIHAEKAHPDISCFEDSVGTLTQPYLTGPESEKDDIELVTMLKRLDEECEKNSPEDVDIYEIAFGNDCILKALASLWLKAGVI